MDTITTPCGCISRYLPGLRVRTGYPTVPDHLKGPNDQVLPNDPFPEESVLPVTVIIPTQNNELTIGTLVILSKKYAATVIVADTGSTDRTMEVAERAGAVVIDALAYGRAGSSQLSPAARWRSGTTTRQLSWSTVVANT